MSVIYNIIDFITRKVLINILHYNNVLLCSHTVGVWRDLLGGIQRRPHPLPWDGPLGRGADGGGRGKAGQAKKHSMHSRNVCKQAVRKYYA